MPEARGPDPASPVAARSQTNNRASLQAPLFMVLATLLFSIMGALVKWASHSYSAAEIVMYRGLVGVFVMAAFCRWEGTPLSTAVPAMHLWRALTGVLSLGLWFYSIGGLPLGTAVTLNYMSSVWMALFVMGGSVIASQPRGVDGRLVVTVLIGFLGVALVLRPTIDERQLWFGLAGLLSGVLAAVAYLQVTALGRVGEPEGRVVFYFSLAGVVGGAAVCLASGGFAGHHFNGLMSLLLIGLLATSAQWFMTRAYAIGSPLANGALSYLGVVFAFVLGVWLFDDPVTQTALAGMMLIAAAGVAATALRSRHPAAARSRDKTA